VLVAHAGLVLAVPVPVVLAVDVTPAVALKRAGLAADVWHVAGLRLAGLPVNVPLAVVPVCLLNDVHVTVA
jgi:hypothetical protein